MHRKKAILFITPFFRPSIGGAETYVDELCEYLRKKKYMVYVLTYQPLYGYETKGDKIEKSENLEIRRYRWIGHDLFHKLEKYPLVRFLYVTVYLLTRTFLWMLRNRHRVDIVDAQGLNAAFINKIFKYFFGKQAVTTILALYNFVPGTFFSKVVKRTLDGSDSILVEKGKSREELTSIGVPETKLVEFNQWVDQARFKPGNKNAAKKELEWGKKFVVLFVGRAIPQKGASVLLEASRRVNSEITFAFITNNTGPVARDIIQASRAYSNVIFVGEVDYDKLHKYYQAADIFCIPSTYEEGVARVVSESISCDTPVIASDRGSLPYVLDHRISIVIEPTVSNFAEKIEYLYNNPEKLGKLTDNCWRFAMENFGKKNIEIILAVYDSIDKSIPSGK